MSLGSTDAPEIDLLTYPSQRAAALIYGCGFRVLLWMSKKKVIHVAFALVCGQAGMGFGCPCRKFFSTNDTPYHACIKHDLVLHARQRND